MRNALRVVGIGGGTGLPVLLAGLSKRPGVELTGIVTTSDNGGSSGRLRDGFSMPAVGDLRNCLVALAGEDSLLADLFQHRFAAGGCLDGHALGNLVVTALYQRTGSLIQASELVRRLLDFEGRVIGASESFTTLCAELSDGRKVCGESQIPAANGIVERIWMEPEAPQPSRGVIEALQTADAIVFAPGSLYTSLLPNLLIDGVAAAIRESAAVRILVCNLMTQPGETDGFSASDHLRAVVRYLGNGFVQHCIVNPAPPVSAANYLAVGSEFVRYDPEGIMALGAMPVSSKRLVSRHGTKIRHNSDTLGRLVVNLAKQRSSVQATLRATQQSVVPAASSFLLQQASE